ncbi:MAG: gluconeogenesis factor YvcK family protein [Bellilinea sp.]
MQSRQKSWLSRVFSGARPLLRWLEPGIGVKRYFFVFLAGTTLLGVGLTLLILDVYRTAPDTWWLPIFSSLSLRGLERPLRILIFGGIGFGLVLYGVMGINRSLLKPFVRPGKQLLDTVTNYRRRDRGPRVVAIGGGNGLSSLLRGIKFYTHNITAIVTVADDGGSSGELRQKLGVLPPGDIRNCLAALSDDEELITQLFKYRFGESAGLNGHSLGNLLITALSDITGSFETAVAESGKVLAVRGRVLPSTLHDVKLVADLHQAGADREVRVKGESNIPTTPGKVQQVWLDPNNPAAYPPAIQAILGAELIIIGPGSLFTSILPNLLVPDIAAALKASRAYKFYVCNVATQPGETDGFSSYDHVRTIERHLGGRVFHLIVCNSKEMTGLPENVQQVLPELKLEENYAVYSANLVDEEQPWRHDAIKLARSIMDLFYERTGPQTLREDYPNR